MQVPALAFAWLYRTIGWVTYKLTVEDAAAAAPTCCTSLTNAACRACWWGNISFTAELATLAVYLLLPRLSLREKIMGVPLV